MSPMIDDVGSDLSGDITHVGTTRPRPDQQVFGVGQAEPASGPWPGPYVGGVPVLVIAAGLVGAGLLAWAALRGD